MSRLERWVALLERRRGAVLGLAAVVVALGLLSLTQLRLDLDLLAQLPSRSPAFRDFRLLLESFGGRDDLVVWVRGEPGDVERFVAPFGDAVATLPGVAGVQSTVDVARFQRELITPERWRLLDERGYDEVARRLAPAAIEERVRGLRRALAAPLATGIAGPIAADPLGIDEIVARSIARRYADPRIGAAAAGGGDALVVVRPQTSSFDVVAAERLMSAVREAESAARTAAEGTLEVGYTGGVVYALADKERLRADLSLAFLLAPAVVVLAFALGLRDRRALPIALAPLVAVTAVTFALSLLLYERLNMVSIAFAGIFFGLGIDSGIYLLSALAARPVDEPRARAVAAALSEIGPANVVASITSAAVFFLIGASHFTGVAQLGVLSGIAMLANVAGTFVLLPALLVGGRRPTPLPPPGSWSRRASAAVAALAGRRRAVVLGLAGLTLALLVPASTARLETRFEALRPPGGEAQAVERAIEEAFGALDVHGAAIVRAATLDEALEATERLVAALEHERAEGRVAGFTALSTLLPSERTAAARRERFRALPREAAASALADALAGQGFRARAFEPFLDELRRGPPPRDAEALLAGPLAPIAGVHLDRVAGEVRLATFVAPASGHSFAEVAARLDDVLDDPRVVLTGRAIAEAELHRILAAELGLFLVAALGVNFLLLVLAERSLRRAAILLAPTMLGVVGTLALLGALGIAIDPVNLIVLPLLVGLGVDHGVYLAATIRTHGALADRLARALRPLLVVVATTVAAFAVLAFAGYPALAGLGRAGAIALGVGAAATFLCLPLLVVAFHPRGDGAAGER